MLARVGSETSNDLPSVQLEAEPKTRWLQSDPFTKPRPTLCESRPETCHRPRRDKQTDDQAIDIEGSTTKHGSYVTFEILACPWRRRALPTQFAEAHTTARCRRLTLVGHYPKPPMSFISVTDWQFHLKALAGETKLQQSHPNVRP